MSILGIDLFGYDAREELRKQESQYEAIENKVDNISGQMIALEARVAQLEAEMDSMINRIDVELSNFGNYRQQSEAELLQMEAALKTHLGFTLNILERLNGDRKQRVVRLQTRLRNNLTRSSKALQEVRNASFN
jgi:chromosome segregation ATPase